jgi:hypothetical protein
MDDEVKQQEMMWKVLTVPNGITVAQFPYDYISVINQADRESTLEFYVLSITYDVYNLAYKPNK